MDIDNQYLPPTGSNKFLSLFDLSPEHFAWHDPIPQEIEDRRAQMSDRLIFDILLSSAGILQPDTYFPPLDVPSLDRLLDAITNSDFDDLQKYCLIYWLLKWHEDDKATDFQSKKCVPPQFVTLMDAYWMLERGRDLQKAVAMLSDTRINAQHTSKVLEALNLSEDPMPLIREFVRTAKPALTQPDDIDIYAVALAESSLLEAWQFQRTFPESNPTRPRLLNKILDWCLSPKPRPLPLTKLVAFPLSAFEQNHLHRFAAHPPSTIPPNSVPVIQDLVCVRLVQSGQYASAIKLDRQFLTHSANPNPRVLAASQERRRMMEDIMAAMPPVEREMIAIELERLSQAKAPLAAAGSQDSLLSSDLSISWEDLRPLIVNGDVIPSPAVNRTQSFGTLPIIADLSASSRLGASTSSPRMHDATRVVNQPRFPPNRSAPPPARTAPTTPTPSSSNPPPFTAPFIVNSVALSPLAGRVVQSPPAQPSLFTSIGSANRARNAFYEPPVSNGMKRAFGEDNPRTAPEISAEIVTSTVEPEQERFQQGEPTQEDEDQMESVHDEHSTELDYSLFGSKTSAPARPKRTGPHTKLPPGAFVESDEETETESVSVERRPESPPIRQEPSRRGRRTQTKETHLSRSLPGALVMDEDEGSEDQVGPLPPSPPRKRQGRRGRVSRKASNQPEPEGMTLRPRRSNRLSRASPSPEPPPAAESAPSRTRKKTTRASGTSSGDAKTATRKKRQAATDA